MANMWKGNKIFLRTVKMSDLDTFFNTEIDFDTGDQRRGFFVLSPISMIEQRERVEKFAKNSFENDELMLIMEDKDGNPVGSINTHSCNKKNGSFEYGVGVKGEHRGKGYAKEAIIMVLRYFFGELRYNKVNIRVYSFNVPCIKLHENFGFKQEGIIRENYYTNGKFYDEVLFGLTRKEFEENIGYGEL
jgi:RimJ/RimL family protein N-acetyltransferase